MITRTPKGNTAKLTGTTYSKALGRPPGAWHARHRPTGRFVDSGGRVQRAKKGGENKCFSALNKINATTERLITTHIQILSTDMENASSQSLFGH